MDESWHVTMKNSTDYKVPLLFTSVREIKEFVRKYYTGFSGDKYWENWVVEGDYPDELFDVLDIDLAGNWFPRHE